MMAPRDGKPGGSGSAGDANNQSRLRQRQSQGNSASIPPGEWQSWVTTQAIRRHLPDELTSPICRATVFSPGQTFVRHASTRRTRRHITPSW